MPKKEYQTSPHKQNGRPDADQMVLVQQKRRYEKVRSLCTKLNRKRRHLRDKVDLLCKDLVRSNKQLARTMGDLRLLCDFQHEVMGENDLTYLLHKAIRILIADLPQTGAAIFLSATRKFEAHVSGAWQRLDADFESIESVLQEAVIEVARNAKPIFLGDRYPNSPTIAHASDEEYPYTMMGLPITVPGELVAVAVFYRDSQDCFNTQEQARLQSCLLSLGRQIVAVQRLHAFLNQANC